MVHTSDKDNFFSSVCCHLQLIRYIDGMTEILQPDASWCCVGFCMVLRGIGKYLYSLTHGRFIRSIDSQVGGFLMWDQVVCCISKHPILLSHNSTPRPLTPRRLVQTANLTEKFFLILDIDRLVYDWLSFFFFFCAVTLLRTNQR
jgi:hypothetical protein